MATIVGLPCCFPYDTIKNPSGDGGYSRIHFLHNRLSTPSCLSRHCIIQNPCVVLISQCRSQLSPGVTPLATIVVYALHGTSRTIPCQWNT